MNNKVLGFILLSIVSLNAGLIKKDIIKPNTFGLRVSSCITTECLINTKNKLINEEYHTVYANKINQTYIVNIENIKIAQQLKIKYSKIFYKVHIQENLPLFLNYIKQNNKTSKQIPLSKIKNKIKTKLLKKYSLALEYFKAKQYEKAYQLFDELFHKTLNETNINFFLGKSAFETKRYHEAILAYQRVLFEIPDNIGATIETAKVSIAQENYDEAEVLLENIKNNPQISKQALKNIQSYLETIDDKKQKHFISGMFMFGLNYDSNINNRSLNNTFTNVYVPLFNTFIDMQNTTKDESANAHQEIVVLNYKYKLNNKVSILNDFMIYNKMMTNDKLQDKDIKLFSYTPSIDLNYKNGLHLNLALKYDDIRINNDNYMKSYTFMTKFNYNLKNIYNIKHRFKYQNKKYQKNDDKSKDSIFIELDNSIRYSYSKRLSFSPALVLSQERVKNKDTKDISFDAINLKFSTTYLYLSNLMFTPSISFRQKRYKDSSELVKRKDLLKEIGLTATYVINPNWIIQTGIAYKKQLSTTQMNEYKKHTLMFNIIRSFK